MQLADHHFANKRRNYKCAHLVDTHQNQTLFFTLHCDDHAVLTPAGNPMQLQESRLAAALCAEWDGVEKQLDPLKMPYTRLAATLIDHVPAKRAQMIEDVLALADGDMLRYHNPANQALYKKQQTEWQPILHETEWQLKIELPICLDLSLGVLDDSSKAIIHDYVSALSDGALFCIHEFAQNTHSFALAYGLIKQQLNIERALDCALLEFKVQQDLWGDDPVFEQERATLEQAIIQASMLIA